MTRGSSPTQSLLIIPAYNFNTVVDRMLSSVTLVIPRQLFKRTHQEVTSKSFGVEKGKVALRWKFFLLHLCKNYFQLDLLIYRCGAANDVQ